MVRRDWLGFSEVIQAVDPVGGVVLHEEYDTAAAFHIREQWQMIGAEVKHRKKNQEREWDSLAGSAVEELTGGLLHARYRHRAAPGLSQAALGFVRWLALITFAKALAT